MTRFWCSCCDSIDQNVFGYCVISTLEIRPGFVSRILAINPQFFIPLRFDIENSPCQFRQIRSLLSRWRKNSRNFSSFFSKYVRSARFARKLPTFFEIPGQKRNICGHYAINDVGTPYWWRQHTLSMTSAHLIDDAVTPYRWRHYVWRRNSVLSTTSPWRHTRFIHTWRHHDDDAVALWKRRRGRP